MDHNDFKRIFMSAILGILERSVRPLPDGEEAERHIHKIMATDSFNEVKDQMLELWSLEVTFRGDPEELTEETLTEQITFLAAAFLSGLATMEHVMNSGELR